MTETYEAITTEYDELRKRILKEHLGTRKALEQLTEREWFVFIAATSTNYRPFKGAVENAQYWLTVPKAERIQSWSSDLHLD